MQGRKIADDSIKYMEDRYKKSKENKIEIKRQNGIKTNWLKICIESQKKNNEKEQIICNIVQVYWNKNILK